MLGFRSWGLSRLKAFCFRSSEALEVVRGLGSVGSRGVEFSVFRAFVHLGIRVAAR